MNKTIDEETKAALEKMISDGVVSRESAVKYFPELKESEGEEIRKEIIAILKYKYEKFPKAPRYSNVPKWIDWLEKQGAHTALSKDEQNKLAKGVLRSCAFSFINYLDSHRYESKMDVSNGECEDIENAFQNAMWDRLHRYYCKYIEKQGEQNTIDKIQIGKKYKCIASPRYSTFIKGLIYKPEDEFLCSLMNFYPDCFEPIEDVEQKQTDKVEPKFHKGDWVVYCNDDVDLITGIEEKGYCINNGGYIPFVCESDMRLWTIRDAKDGDVLVASDDSIFLFKDRDYSACKHYVALTTDGAVKFNEGLEHYWETVTAVHPATNKQRYLLFKKMHEAGYEWDAEHKQLNKIEQKSATMSLDEAIEHCKEKSCGNNACALEHKQLEKWLTELKELKEQKPAEWSEEDEKMIKRTKEYLNTAIGDLSNKLHNRRIVTIGNSEYSSMMFGITECISWLEVRFKSLRPQDRWKPSDEQITWLYRATDEVRKDSRMKQVLNGLLCDLKKLREE